LERTEGQEKRDGDYIQTFPEGTLFSFRSRSMQSTMTLSPDFIPHLKAGEEPDSEDKLLLFVMRMDWLGKVVGPN
jgi:hypothetical protein